MPSGALIVDDADLAALLPEPVFRKVAPMPPRTDRGIDCLACGEEIPPARRAVLPNCCLCVECQDDAERAMGR